MELQPFRIQAPEDIAKEYGGNKQRIAQAMQAGLIDPTAGVLAGMFIDRIRSAQVQEMVPQPTVAQQVMGGLSSSSSSPAPPMTPPAGLGVLPVPGAGAMPPTPQAQPVDAPMGMADGGLASLPIPDTMFDEPDNGGYGGGGLVAFADGGRIDPDRLRAALRAQESGGDYGILNREGSGAMGAYQFMPDTARVLARRLGLDYRPELMQGARGRSKEGIEYQERLMDAQMKDILSFAGGDVGRAGIYHFAGPNPKLHGPKTRQYEQDILRRYTGSRDAGEAPERDIQTAQGRRMSREDQLQLAEELYGRLPSAGYEDAEEYYRKALDPEERRKQRKEDMWMALAQLGASMASSKSPRFLQAAGEAIAAALPGAAASRKERREAERDAVRGLMEVNKLRRGEAKEVLTYANQAYATEIDVEEKQAARTAEQEERSRDRAARREEIKMQVDAQLSAARIAASSRERDLMTTAVMNKYAELQKMNAERPMKGPNEPFDPYRHRLADETVFNNAFKAIMGTRYPNTTDATAPGIPQPGGGGAASGQQAAINVGGWND